MLVAAVIGYFTLGLKGDYFCIATLGSAESMRLIFDNIDYFGGARGLSGIPMETNLTVVIIICAMAVVVMTLLIKSRHGRA